jgi:hypothetical protein
MCGGEEKILTLCVFCGSFFLSKKKKILVKFAKQTRANGIMIRAIPHFDFILHMFFRSTSAHSRKPTRTTSNQHPDPDPDSNPDATHRKESISPSQMSMGAPATRRGTNARNDVVTLVSASDQNSSSSGPDSSV